MELIGRFVLLHFKTMLTILHLFYKKHFTIFQDVQLSLRGLLTPLQNLQTEIQNLPQDNPVVQQLTQFTDDVNNVDRDYDIFVGDLMIAWQDELGLLELTNNLKHAAEAVPCTSTLSHEEQVAYINDNLPFIRKEAEQLKLQSITVAPKRKLVRRGEGLPTEPYDTILRKLDDFEAKAKLSAKQEEINKDKENVLALLKKFRAPLDELERNKMRSSNEASEDIKSLMVSILQNEK